MKRQAQINRRKAEAALAPLASAIFDIKTDPLEKRLGELPAKRKSKQNKEAATQPDPQVSVVPTDFASEADSINQMHRELVSLGLTMLERMFQIGERLSSIKEQLPHGAWEQWVDDHLQFTTRTARRYIRAFKHRHDTLATADPVLFLEQIQGNAEPKSDSKSKSDVDVRFDEALSSDSEIDQPELKIKVERRNLHKHWSRAAVDAKEAIDQLIDLQSQYAAWLDELSSEQRSSDSGDRFLAIIHLDLTAALQLIEEAASTELPRL
jgi:hypothetical protein